MTPDTAFQLLNAAVLPWWAIFLAAPRSQLALRLASHGGVFVAIGAIYVALLVAGIAGGQGGGLDLAGLQRAFASPIVFLAGWAHYLAFDLFVGAWIVRESARLRVDPRVFLVVTLMTGPIGLASFLLRRAWLLRSFGQLGERDLV